MKRIKFVGTNTAKNIWWKYEGDSFQEIYDQLVADDVISFYDEYEPIVKDYAEEHGLDLDDEDQFLQAYENAFDFLPDEDYRKYIEQEDGNAYYQWFYEWTDNGWQEI